MQLETQRFGTLAIPEESIIEFEQGLYGFEEQHRFALVPVDSDQTRLLWLLSVDDPALALLIADPTLISQGYNPPVDPADLRALGLDSIHDGIVMAVCVLSADPAKITVNLQAPIIFNPTTRKGRQVIGLDPSLPVRQPVFQAAKS
ncbi:MAG: flagellar assembly protein FliW [Symbiobacteriia bacterium]